MRLVTANAGQMMYESPGQEGEAGPCIDGAWLVHPKSLWYGIGFEPKSTKVLDAQDARGRLGQPRVEYRLSGHD